MKNYTKEEIERLEKKANMYDEIEEKIASYYDEDVPEEIGLDDIGEWICTYFGWLD